MDKPAPLDAARADRSISDSAAVCQKNVSESFPFIQRRFRFAPLLLFPSSKGKAAQAGVVCPQTSHSTDIHKALMES